MPGRDIAAEVLAMRQAMPSDRLRLLVPDHGEQTDLEYLAILAVLQRASRVGTGDLSHDDLVRRAREAVQAVTGEHLSENILNTRFVQLDEWGVIEKYLETGRDVDLSQWRRRRQGYRLSSDGDLILELLQSAVNRRSRPTSTLEAENLLGHVEEGLRRLCDSYDDTEARRNHTREESEQWLRDSYLNLHRIVVGDHARLLEYLRDLNKLILEFGRHTRLDAVELDMVLDRLEAYMEGIHAQFQGRSQRIRILCNQLINEHMPDLDLGYHLAKQADEDFSFFGQAGRSWPKPRDILERLDSFFDAEQSTSLSQEVQRVRGNTRLVISRIRDHWQRLLERSRAVQHLERTWRDLKRLDYADDAAWEPWLRWNARLLVPSRLPTAPGLRDGAGEGGQPPTPRRRHTYTGVVHRDVVIQEPVGDPDRQREQEAAAAMRLNDFVMQRVIRGRKEGRLSDFDLQDHTDFRALLAIVKHSELLLHTPTAKAYFQFKARYDENAPRVTWRLDGVTYDAPEILFEALVQPRLEKPVHV